MTKRKSPQYGNDSITQLKGADRVRKRPGVIFGSDGVDGCAHSIFEILSNSIDEAREGHGSKIIITRYLDRSLEVEDFGFAVHERKEDDPVGSLQLGMFVEGVEHDLGVGVLLDLDDDLHAGAAGAFVV